jgi:ligand-binding SRPBCC domain-containing protein
MKLRILTSVTQEFSIVVENFNQQLFQKLNPSFPIVTILRYDGNSKGDEIHLKLNFLLFDKTWVSVITENMSSDKEFYFIDEGRQLPFFLKTWRHVHRIIENKDKTIIEDDINFESRWKWMEPLAYPLFYMQFRIRKPIYRRYFNELPKHG